MKWKVRLKRAKALAAKEAKPLGELLRESLEEKIASLQVIKEQKKGI